MCYHQICQVYGGNETSDGMVKKWVRMFNEGRENVHDKAWSGRPSLVNDDLLRKVNERVRDDRRFTISDLSLQFPQISKDSILRHCQQSFGSQAAAFYEEGIQKLVLRYDNCLNNGGEYVEK